MKVKMRQDLIDDGVQIGGFVAQHVWLTPEEISEASVISQDDVTGQVTLFIIRPYDTKLVVKVDSIDLEFVNE
jgi:hypothetical protein